MRLPRAALTLLLLAALTGACGDDDDDDGTGVPNVSIFAGTWTATSIRYTSVSTQSRTLDVAQLGGGLTLIITSNGAFSGTFKLPTAQGVQTIPITGQVAVQSATQARVDFNWPGALAQNPPITNFNATFAMQGNNLTFTRPDATFQFPGQAAAEAAVLVIAMTRS